LVTRWPAGSAVTGEELVKARKNETAEKSVEGYVTSCAARASASGLAQVLRAVDHRGGLLWKCWSREEGVERWQGREVVILLGEDAGVSNESYGQVR
jgi:hypothetical protein